MATTTASSPTRFPDGPPFAIILAYEGLITGDNRSTAPGGWNWPDRPIPLRDVPADHGGHDGAFPVGLVTNITRVPLADLGVTSHDATVPGVTPQAIIGRGNFDTSPQALETARMVANGTKSGVSVDPIARSGTLLAIDGDGNLVNPDAFDMSDMDAIGAFITAGGRFIDYYTNSRIRAVTIVDIPAFEDSQILDVGGIPDLEATYRARSDQVPDPTGLTAAASDRSGAMVALVPSPSDAARLAIDGFEPAESLHLTLAFLGEAASIDEPTRQAITDAVTENFSSASGIVGNTWAAARFNPTDDPVTAYLVGGEGFAQLHEDVMGVVSGVAQIPDQHSPFVPHVTIAYGDLDPNLLEVFDTITFDRIRVAFAGENFDIPLGGVDDDDGGGDDEDEVSEAPEAPENPDAPDDPDSPFTLIAAAVEPHDTPVAARGTGWDGNAAEKAMPSGEDPTFYRQFYAYHNEEKGDGTAKDHWHYLHHFVKGGGVDATIGSASPEACTAIIQVLNGARGVSLTVRGAQRQTVYDHVARHLADAGEEVPPLKPEGEVIASAAPIGDVMDNDPATLLAPDCDDFFKGSDGSGGSDANTMTASADTPFTFPTVPAAHFEPINFDHETPLTILESGHVYGHVALDKICHVGMPACVTMPRSETSLRYFHTGLVRLDDGSDLATGRLTVSGSHAPVELDWMSAMAHYDNTSAAFADVIAWEDDHGIAVTGHLREGVDPSLLAAARASTPSGDWRRIGHSAELINVHMVNAPGFPVYRTDDYGLVASVAASASPVAWKPSPATLVADANIPDEIAMRVVTILTMNEIMDAVQPHRELAADAIARRYLNT